ncbi:hypothetical protein vseg_015942 [Gypsophila vaccaria]
MGRDPRTIEELKAPDMELQPSFIVYSPLPQGVSFELKSGLINNLPSFHGLNGEDPNKHLSEFHTTCVSMRPRDATEEQMKLRAFPFSLKDKARDWLYYLLSGSITTWKSLKQTFLDMYYSTTKSTHLKKDISSVEQEMSETLYGYWEHFKRMCGSCPYHEYSDEDLIFYFCGGLSPEDSRMVNSATQGGIIYNTSQDEQSIIERLAKSSRNFSKRAP